MKRVVPVVLSAVLAGCSYSNWSLNSSSGTTSTSGGAVQVNVESGTGLATLIGLSIVAAGAIEMERNREADRYYPQRSFPLSGRDVPPLAPDRVVTEQDCTRPIEEFSGNLRCR